ncbi:hypothetical protein AC622_01735 [Bacillus sp. FJAT-27916]|nr:hypothetical protein AC622_01735 [Bacillus sp. FJAT-27916]
MGIVRESPPYSQAKHRKGGGRVDKAWEKPGTAHPSPRQGIGRMGKGWTNNIPDLPRRPSLFDPFPSPPLFL